MKNGNVGTIITRNLGILLFLLVSLGMVYTVTLAPTAMRDVFIIIIAVTYFAAMLGFMGKIALSYLLCGTLVCVWITFKMYNVLAYGTELVLSDYLFVPLPMLTGLAVLLFDRGEKRLSGENTILRQQVDELVMVDSLTKLYNLRALYHDMLAQAAFARRKNLSACLVIMDVKYSQEYQAMLSDQQFQQLRQRLATLVLDTVRVEDKVYAINDVGSVAILCYCEREAAMIMTQRIKRVVGDRRAFEGILESNLNVVMRAAAGEYSTDDDPMTVKKKIESELVYDV